MKIVTDSGSDMTFAPEIMEEMKKVVTVVPLKVTLDGKTYREAVDITKDEFYNLLDKTDDLPVTSTPSTGEFAEVYRDLSKDGEEILSIHMSSGLSGTYNASLQGVKEVPEAKITSFDMLTLAGTSGWGSYAAFKAIKAGWDVEKIVGLLEKIRDNNSTIYTLNDLKYLIHGGRISHMRGLLASLLNIKPLIGVAKDIGNYEQLGQQRTFNRALDGLVNIMKKRHGAGSKITVQVMHSANPEAGKLLSEKIDKVFDVNWLPLGPMSLILGAHTGRTMVGVASIAQEIWDLIP